METERLLVRRFRPEDASVLAGYRSDPEVARYQSWEPPVSVAEATVLVGEFTPADPDSPGWSQYAVERTADGVLVGDVGVNLHENLMQAEIGFTIATEHQGRGYATEAVSRVLGMLFDERGMRRVSAECDARNTASARLLAKVGFRLEGTRPANTWIRGEWTDDLLFGLLAEDWANR